MLRRKHIKTDFCVIGGGISGICAAIAAARNGSKVVLMHERPVLGGNASSEIRMWVCGAQGENNRETGIIEEIALENYYRNPTKNFFIFDTVLYDFVLREKNITLLLNCTCMDAQTENGDFGDGRDIRITQVTGYQMTTQTFFDISADYYSDCSGDSILAPLTGAQFRMGREGRDEHGENTHVKVRDDLTMGMSCLIQGRETTQEVKFTPPEWSTKLTSENFADRHLDITKDHENYWYLELGGNRDSIHDTEEISRELLPLAIGTWDHIKNSGEFDAKTWELDFLGFLPGKRESRRMMGEYIINANDILENRIFEDTVAFGGWPIDDHFPDGFYHKGAPNTNIMPPAPYCIPYRCLYSKNVSNLFFAGRNISMTHMAMSSMRVMATCAVMGQAVGTAAAIAKRNELSPHGVYLHKLEELQDILADSDCLLPNRLRKISDLCRNTVLTGGSDKLKNGFDRPHKMYNDLTCGAAVENGTPVTYRFDAPEKIEAVHITFNSDLNRYSLPGEQCERTHMTRANTLLSSPQFYVPTTLCKSFRLEIETENGTEVLLESNRNLNRAYQVPVEKAVKSITLIPLSNWGGSSSTEIYSFDFR